MTVEDPVFPSCPSCDHDVLGGVEEVSRLVTTDDDGNATDIETTEGLDEWHALWCDSCGKSLIREGEWVVDPDDGSPRMTNGAGHRTFDEFSGEFDEYE